MVFDVLEKRLILKGVIETVTPLHIGSGKSDMDIDEVDMPILRAPDGAPYIPGSSLKGKLRSEVEKLAKSTGMEVCTPPNIKDMCGSKVRNPLDLCIACRLFGTAGRNISMASKVKLRDAYPVESVDVLLERHGTAIDRASGTVSRSALYKTEAVPVGARFNFELVAENLESDEERYLKAALKSLEDSALGGGSSRGFGKIRFVFDALVIRGPGYYLGEEADNVLSGEKLSQWLG
ncbi:MAG: type III CRISPR-associated RAMP protein Csx7 [Candidatus Ranarchaeia archaeon]